MPKQYHEHRPPTRVATTSYADLGSKAREANSRKAPRRRKSRVIYTRPKPDFGGTGKSASCLNVTPMPERVLRQYHRTMEASK